MTRSCHRGLLTISHHRDGCPDLWTASPDDEKMTEVKYQDEGQCGAGTMPAPDIWGRENMRKRILSKLKSIAGVLVGEAKIRDNTSVDAVRTDRREKRQEAVEDCGVTLRRRGLIFGVSALAGSGLALLSRPARAGHQGGNTFHLGTPPLTNLSKQFTNLRRETGNKNS